ncbi:MAG: RNA dependent RNA polymerase [Xiangshan rhabdo-like virus 3]|uniref:RNA-directed RNA polymerase L n=1 Tax=Xiangshan rhabdo-like virus 3 TaxID=2886226 RepID=A0A8K1P3J2_9RHAB|nr:MAG: RNA dependent RNA polymerase [Xiangshan rhabdo-like virus 3]
MQSTLLDDLFDADEELQGAGRPPPLPTHCNVPLKESLARIALNKKAPGQHIPQHHRCKTEWASILQRAGEPRVDYLNTAHLQYLLLNTLQISDNTLIRAEWEQQLQVAEQGWKLNCAALKKVYAGPLPDALKNLTRTDKEYLYPSYLIKAFFEEAVLASGSDTYVPQFWWKKNLQGVCEAVVGTSKLFCTKNLWYIQTQDGSALVSRDHLTLFSDLASQRYLLRLLALTEEESPNCSFVSPEVLDQFLLNGDLILRQGGNAAYKIIYGLEPQCLSELVGSIPVGSPTNQDFRTIVHVDLLEHAKKLRVVKLYQDRRSLISSISSNPELISQVFGLYRIWGHPTIEPLEGAIALKKIATQVRLLNQEVVSDITNKWREEFIKRHLALHKRWPSIDCSNLAPSNIIRESYEANKLFPERHTRYRRSHLSLISFTQNLPVDPKFDLIEMLSDKALSLATPDLLEHLQTGRGPGTAEERSVLLNWLKSSMHDPKQFIDYIDKYGFPLHESSVGLREKEREGKIEARLFGLTTLFKRMYIVLTEAMLAEHILPLFPEITMTDDELTLDKKRHNFTKKKGASRSLFTSLDFSKWNSNMREEETKPMFTDFDHLFGLTAVFSRTHEMFNTSFMYLLNGSYLPKFSQGALIPSIGSWTGHLGGIEGLRQKGWTIWTVCLILLSAEEHALRIQLMGQGDNQILRESFEAHLSDQDIMSIHFKFLHSMDLILSKAGPPLKMEETWTSRDLYVYGKYIMFKGAPLPTYAKRLCRMFKLSNEDFPTMESALSSLTANLSSALACHYHPGVLYYLYLTEVTSLFQSSFRSSYFQMQKPQKLLSQPSMLFIPLAQGCQRVSLPPLLGKQPLHPNSLYLRLILLPRALGGYPIINLLMALIRGFPDEVSLSISCLKLIHSVASNKLQSYIKNILEPPLAPIPNYEMLFEHPTALNLLVPSTPGESRRNVVVEFLSQTPRIKNQYFKTFMALVKHRTDSHLCNYLAQATPFNPRYLGAIVGSTVEARARHIAGKLQKTKTISKLAIEEGKQDIYTTVMNSELNHLKSVLRLATLPNTSSTTWSPRKCSLDHAQELREKGWQKKVEGVDCVPPYEFMCVEEVKPLEKCSSSWELDKGYIAVKLSSQLTPDELQHPLTMGPHVPYRGSVTRQKTSGFGDKLATQADPLLTKLLRLFSTIGWATPRNGNIQRLLIDMLKSATDLDESYLIPEDESIAGSVHHRLQDERSGHGGAVVILPNFGSKFVFDTFPLSAYSKGSKNVNFMFQSVMSLATVLMSWRLSGKNGNLPQTFHIHVATSCCVRPINEEPIDCPVPHQFPIIGQKENPYLFIAADKLFPDHLKSSFYPATLSYPSSPQEAQDRLQSALSLEIFMILNPHHWEAQSYHHHSRTLVINWALRCPLLQTMESLVLLLCTHYLSSIRSSTPHDFLIRVQERIIRSPIAPWSQLSNLLFCPNFHHELVRDPYLTSLSGNPSLTPEILGYNLRALAASISAGWASLPAGKERLESLPIGSSPFCGASYHPSMQLLTRDYLGDRAPHELLKVRMHLVSSLVDSKFLIANQFLKDTVNHYLKQGSKLIFRESLDTLCKIAPEIPSLSPPSLTDVRLPLACLKLWTSLSSQLVYAITKYQTQTPLSPIGYASHGSRLFANPTSGPYKGLSLLRESGIHEPDSVLCLGDGAGGFTWSVLRFFQSTTVLYNTLTNSDNAIQQASSIPYIPSLAGWPLLERRLLPLTSVNEYNSDFTNPDFAALIHTKVQKAFDGIMCDAECPEYLQGKSPLKLALAVLKIASKVSANWVIFKTYALNPVILRQQIAILHSRFSEVSVLRSYFSSAGSSEVYLYSSGPNARSQLRLGPNGVEGFHPPEKIVTFFSSVVLPSILAAPAIPTATIQAYSDAIEPNPELRAFTSINYHLPFLMKDCPVIYPHSINRWIGATTMKKPGQPSLEPRRLETTTFNKPSLQRWIIAYLSIWTSLSDQNPPRLDQDWDKLYLYWFKLGTGSWEFSLGWIEPPQMSEPGVRFWKVSTICTSMHIKIIHRLRSLINVLNRPLLSLSPDISRGSLNAQGKGLSSKQRASSAWIRANLQPDQLARDVPAPQTVDTEAVIKDLRLEFRSVRL